MYENVITKCRHCRKPIEDDAKVCHNCGRHQNWFFRHLRVEQLGILAAFIMIALVYSQLREARQKRTEVGEALTQAIEAKDIATNAAVRSQTSEQNTKILDEAFRKQALFITEITWLQLDTKHQFGTKKAKRAANKILDDVNSLLRIAIPKDNDRAKWIQEMQSY